MHNKATPVHLHKTARVRAIRCWLPWPNRPKPDAFPTGRSDPLSNIGTARISVYAVNAVSSFQSPGVLRLQYHRSTFASSSSSSSSSSSCPISRSSHPLQHRPGTVPIRNPLAQNPVWRLHDIGVRWGMQRRVVSSSVGRPLFCRSGRSVVGEFPRTMQGIDGQRIDPEWMVVRETSNHSRRPRP